MIPGYGALNDTVLSSQDSGNDLSLSHFFPFSFSTPLHLGKQEAHQLTRTLPRDIFPKTDLLP